MRELCGYIWQSVPTLVSVPSRTPVQSASRSRSSRIGGWILPTAPLSRASASGAVQYRKAASVSPNTGQPLSLRSRISSTLCQALVCTTYTGVPTSCAISAAG